MSLPDNIRSNHSSVFVRQNAAWHKQDGADLSISAQRLVGIRSNAVSCVCLLLHDGLRMMRLPLALVLLCCLTAAILRAQQTGPNQRAADQTNTGQIILTVHSNLVEVPVMVKTKEGKNVFELTASDFQLTDDGVPQHLVLDPDSDFQPLALTVVVETGGAGARHLGDYGHLNAILDALIGSVDHRIAVIGFDSTPHLLVPFTAETSAASAQLAHLASGDQGASILDAVAFAAQQLRTQPARYRRAILLLSETVDQGSTTTLDEALRLISDTNTMIYSFAFSSTRAAVSHEASKFDRHYDPGPAHGCFSRDGADAEYEGHYSKQVLDCISMLAPPLRFATMAYLGARGNLRRNTAESITQLTGGEFLHFRDAKDLQKGLIAVSNDVPNFYLLSFHPSSLTPGLHSLHVELKNHPGLELRSRSEYWIDTETSP
jgi:VWFA-related protein